MGHAAALYTVRVKERYRDHQRLGDFDDRGSYLLEVMDRYLDGFEARGGDERVLRVLNKQVEGEELTAMMQYGQSGIAADIVDQAGAPRIRQISTDTQLVRCGCLARLPRAETTGWLALHVNNGRGMKSILEQGLVPRFQEAFPDFLLQVTPFVRGSALREAVNADQLQKVRLIRYERPNDRAAASTNKWVAANQFGKLELVLSMRGRGQMLRGRLLDRFLGGEDRAIDDILEFEGMTFEQAKVEVRIDGRTRTINLERPSAGHALTVEITPELDDDGDPTEESLMEALRDALGAVVD